MHRLLDAIDEPALRGHAGRVAALAVRVGMRLRLNASHLREVALCAQLHDVGRIAMPVRDGALSPVAFDRIRGHAWVGARICSRVAGLSVAARGVGEHHERWDGAGFPESREGQAISLTARIVAVADAYDVYLSRHAGASRDEAIAEIVCGSGSLFDPIVVDEFIRVVGATERVARVAAA